MNSQLLKYTESCACISESNGLGFGLQQRGYRRRREKTCLMLDDLNDDKRGTVLNAKVRSA